MSKVICDVCGTSYPDTATQCPICGYVRTASTQSAAGTAAQGDTKEGYTYVKGGRFSKANVKKRNNANGIVTVNVVRDTKKSTPKKKNDNTSNKGLVIAVLILLIAVIAVVLFITFRYVIFNDTKKTDETTAPVATEPSDSEQETEEDTPTQFQFVKSEITITERDATVDLVINPMPASTDQLTVISSNNDVATAVLRNGVVRVTAVKSGEAIIRLSSGAECKVVCDITIELSVKGNILLSSVDATDDILRNRADFTEEELAEIEWSSSNESVATVDNGIVTAGSTGDAVITAKYRGQEFQCEVKCDFSADGSSTGDAELDYSVSVGTGGGITPD